MKEQRISFPTAKMAKSKGFSEPCGLSYSFCGLLIRTENEMYPAPTQSLLQKWFRDRHNIDVAVFRLNNKWTYAPFDIVGSKYLNSVYEYFGTYEEALEAGLLEALNLI